MKMLTLYFDSQVITIIGFSLMQIRNFEQINFMNIK